MPLVMFPQELIDLQHEIAASPDVCQYLFDMRAVGLSDTLATLSTYLGILVDMNMDEKQQIAYAEMLTRKLYEKRTGLLLLNP